VRFFQEETFSGCLVPIIGKWVGDAAHQGSREMNHARNKKDRKRLMVFSCGILKNGCLNIILIIKTVSNIFFFYHPGKKAFINPGRWLELDPPSRRQCLPF
jgi:hypothetical protein